MYTAADLAAAKAAYLQAGIDGIASGSIAGQQITGWTAQQWELLISRIEKDLAVANDRPGLGIRVQRIRPTYE